MIGLARTAGPRSAFRAPLLLLEEALLDELVDIRKIGVDIGTGVRRTDGCRRPTGELQITCERLEVPFRQLERK